jgi:hypothetical protein
VVEKDDLNVGMIATVGVVCVALTAATVFAVRGLYTRYAAAEAERKIIAVPAADSDSKVAEQEAKLARYSWVDRDAGTVTIPIERAMRLTVDELRSEAGPGMGAPGPTRGS